MISFIVPSYNCAAFLAQAVKSILDQTHKDCEIIIVNDASTDSTDQYLEWLQGGKRRFPIRVINNVTNLGRSASRNLGNMAAQGDICVLDADDLATPKRADLTADAIRDGAQFVYGSAVMIDAVGRKVGELPADVFNRDRAFKEGVNRIVHSTIGYTKEFASKYPYRMAEISDLGIDDWEQQTRAVLDGVKFDMIPATLAAYRQLDTGISKTRDESKVTEFKKAYLEKALAVA